MEICNFLRNISASALGSAVLYQFQFAAPPQIRLIRTEKRLTDKAKYLRLKLFCRILYGDLTLTPTDSLDPKKLRVAIVSILVALSIQGWSGDVVNIFFAPPGGIKPPPPTLKGFLQVAHALGPLFVWHVYEGIFLVLFSVILLIFTLKWSIKRGVRICAILALLFMLSAAAGGILFVLSGLQDGGNSAQMGGSFIGVYAFYFMQLYFSK